MDRTQYNKLYRAYRQHNVWRDTQLDAHFADARREISHRRLPDDLQYYAVSDAYLYHMDMMIADWGGSQYEAVLERAASAYHNGYSVTFNRRGEPLYD